LTAGGWNRNRPPHVRLTPEQRRNVDAALARVGLPDGRQFRVAPATMRSVLGALVDNWLDGAGYAWPSVELVALSTGFSRRTVFRALQALTSADEPLLARYPCLRDPTKARGGVRQATTVGQTSSLYRLGPTLRSMAALRHPDPAWETGAALQGPQNQSVAPPRSDSNKAARTGAHGTPGHGTPVKPQGARTPRCATNDERQFRGAPEHSNIRNPSLNEGDGARRNEARARDSDVCRSMVGLPRGYHLLPPSERAVIDALNEHFGDGARWIDG
jgi:hypothetical protein